MSLDRSQLESMLSAYLDGELTDAQRAEVEAFLTEDADARQLLDDLRATVAGLKALPRARASDEFADAFRAHLERRALLGSESPRRTPRVSPPLSIGRRFAAAAVIVLAVTAGYVTWSFTRQPPQPPARFALKDTGRLQREDRGEPPAETLWSRDKGGRSDKIAEEAQPTDKRRLDSASPVPGGALPAQPVPPVALVSRDRKKDELGFRPKQDADGISLGLNAQAEGGSQKSVSRSEPDSVSPVPQTIGDRRSLAETADRLTIKTTTAGAAAPEQLDALIVTAPQHEHAGRPFVTAPQTEHYDLFVASGPETDKSSALIRRRGTLPSAGPIASAGQPKSGDAWFAGDTSVGPITAAAKPQSVALAPASAGEPLAATLPVLGPDLAAGTAVAQAPFGEHVLDRRSGPVVSYALNASSASGALSTVQIVGDRSGPSQQFFYGYTATRPAATQSATSAPAATRPAASQSAASAPASTPAPISPAPTTRSP